MFWELICAYYFAADPSVGTSGQGLYEGLDWLSQTIAKRK